MPKGANIFIDATDGERYYLTSQGDWVNDLSQAYRFDPMQQFAYLRKLAKSRRIKAAGHLGVEFLYD